MVNRWAGPAHGGGCVVFHRFGGVLSSLKILNYYFSMKLGWVFLRFLTTSKTVAALLRRIR